MNKMKKEEKFDFTKVKSFKDVKEVMGYSDRE